MTEPSWDADKFEMYLKASGLVKVDGEVKKLADSITKNKDTVLEKAKAVYDWTCENTYRNANTVGCGKGDVCQLLKDPGGKCTDISSIFVALCRASNVPAREVFSLRQGKNPTQDITKWQHCWAEFYLPGYGWVSVDPADVRKKMLRENLKLSDEAIKEVRKYFWGNIDQYRVVIAHGRNVNLIPAQSGAPLNTFGYPYAEVDGKVIDFYNPANFSYTISYTAK